MVVCTKCKKEHDSKTYKVCHRCRQKNRLRYRDKLREEDIGPLLKDYTDGESVAFLAQRYHVPSSVIEEAVKKHSKIRFLFPAIPIV